MTRPIRPAAAAILCALLAAAAAKAEDLALVIGNGDYRRAPQALAARPDAQAVADTLQAGGYRVIRGLDLDRAAMRDRLADFARRAGDADSVVVFYSGHALRMDGRSLLAPVDQRAGSAVDVAFDGVPLDLVLRLAARARGEAVVFLDAAQLDGFSPAAFAEPGLAGIAPPEGVLVVSAAPPGRAVARRTAGRSAFGEEVVSAFLAPGARTAEAVRDLPAPGWVAGDTDFSLVLVPADRAAADDRAAPPAAEDAAPEADDAAAAEARLDLDRGARRRIQRDLDSLGYDTRGIDGIFGPGTRRAVRRWQADNDLPVTGHLDADQISRLRDQAIDARAGDRAAEERADRAWWERTGARGTAQGYRDYLARYPDGRYAREARRALDRLEDDRAGPARDSEDRLRLTRDERRSVEQRLDYLGFEPGRIDGVLDADAREAIRRFQRSRGERATGYLDRPTLSRLVSETRELDAGAAGTRLLFDLLRGLTD